MSDLHETIAANLGETGEETAAAVLAAVRCPTKWAEFFWPLLVEECTHALRQATRRIETQTLRPHSGRVNPVQARNDLLAQRFFNGKEYVAWGEATTADHESRIEFLEGQRLGIARTIARHQWAIDTIRQHNVTALEDIEDVRFPDDPEAAA